MHHDAHSIIYWALTMSLTAYHYYQSTTYQGFDIPVFVRGQKGSAIMVLRENTKVASVQRHTDVVHI